MNMETPSISNTSYAAALATASGATGNPPQFANWSVNDLKLNRAMQNQAQVQPLKKEDFPMAEFSTRLVKVFIVDPNQNIALDNRLLYSGEEKLTDLTDQELFFEIDIQGLLAKHNEIRKTTEDKKANKDKPVYLEAARVRDLKMQVVVLAQF